MQAPRSKFVHDKIVGLAFTEANVGYIGKLLSIEHYVIHGPHSVAEAMAYSSLRKTYPIEYEAIFRELRPADFDRVRRVEARSERELDLEKRRAARAEREQSARDRALWLKFGGTL